MLLGFAWSDVITDGRYGHSSLIGLSKRPTVLILSLPIPMVLKLQLTMRRKIALIGVFLLGAL